MKLQQIQNGHNHYRCILSQELSLDPVYFIKHPIAEQRNAIYDRVEVTKALARRDAINACPQTRQVLAGDQLILESAKMEVLVWVLEGDEPAVVRIVGQLGGYGPVVDSELEGTSFGR